MFVMWLGERISEKGVGNGTSLIIFAGIVAGIPAAVIRLGKLVTAGELGPGSLLIVGIIMLVGVIFILFMERAERRIPIQYGRRVVGSRAYGAQLSHLPLKVNTAGVIPPIFASSLLMFPATFFQFLPPIQLEGRPWLETLMLNLTPGALGYELIYVILIIFFAYFYTAVQFNPEDVAENLRKYGSFIPGVRPGKETAEYIDTVLTRLTLWGALYLSAICVLPSILVKEFNVPFRFGGTGLLIVVGVALDTISQLESQMLVRSYDSFITGVKIRGRRA
jgi:preprotein translocase subunit SecY